MLKVKSLEETVFNYIIGVLSGFPKEVNHWLKQGYSPEKAFENAYKWAIRQLESGVGETFSWKDIAAIFRITAQAINQLAKYCELRAENSSI